MPNIPEERILSKHPLYNSLTPNSKARVHKALRRVLYNWMDGRATTTSELREVFDYKSLYKSSRKTKESGLVNSTSVMKELLPYIPTRTGMLFIIDKSRGSKNAPIKDEAMHKKLREGFRFVKGNFRRSRGSMTRPEAVQRLNDNGKYDHAWNREALFFPVSSIDEVSTKAFLKKLDPVNKEKIEEWFLGKHPKKNPSYSHIAEWEKHQISKFREKRIK